MFDESSKNRTNDQIKLSSVTDRLINAISNIRKRVNADEYTKLTVSQTVSFLALVYEKVRNAIEYREDHLIRRAAIERILKRRLSMNIQGTNEGENVLRELMWARYVTNGSLGEIDIKAVQEIINRFLYIRSQIMQGRSGNARAYFSEFLYQLVTAEIEEFLTPAESQKEADFSYYIFQTLKEKVSIEDIKEEQKDAILFIAIEKAYRKSDQAYQRYHMFRLFYKPLYEYTQEEIEDLVPKLADVFSRIDNLIANTIVEKIVRFIRKQLPPFLILFHIFRQYEQSIPSILSSRASLWSHVDKVARQKYSLISSRLNMLAFRSLIYIFLTKMLFALILEIPVSKLLYNEVNYFAIGVNSLAPPVFMLLIIFSVSVPGDQNTKRIFNRIVDIIDADSTFEKTKAFITRKAKPRRPVLNFGFTLLYLTTFLVTLYVIHVGLKMLSFNLLSEALFIFFISVVAFFAYRIKQLSNMYRLIEKTGFFSPVLDFFFMPILSLGKFFSEGVSRLNFFILLFDVIIEAPFKLIIEVIEEWITFVRLKKEDIV
ncbi:hypothetical protein COV58_00405 [Candidatus Roizmanbacteria bacterium CG11_big_fil_rev_8_21_14_0_20_36_8]|uniref:Uncharacterized protein n=2 Tax=Candidatus Roizmaniibacteriota TaxID=1752723 RepID=A0A2M6IV65_9BACT|nr:MAG: hypothetical protein COV58_00405 [Candidatus Roizmanbacteria bacterium CG11_big_fil_rev_8_21_14_0_20_36_8]PIZ66019.1 MAG: hypothetical protein COY14_01045 [Candidatus Roizmanbacteria bacterium CG_4_10_14_0_2_um_filter_36_9]